MHSSDIDVSFKAVRIFSFLCSDGKEFWSNTFIDYNTVLNELVSCSQITKDNFIHSIKKLFLFNLNSYKTQVEIITDWKVPDAELIVCHSFLTLKPLLNCVESTAVQLFAIWTINHFLSINREHYFQNYISYNNSLDPSILFLF
jgi:hypothetical protein